MAISSGGGSSTVGIVNVDETCTFDTGKITMSSMVLVVMMHLRESANGGPDHSFVGGRNATSFKSNILRGKPISADLANG